MFHLDFNGGNFTKENVLEEVIEKFLSDQEDIYGKNPNSKDIGSRFKDILKAAHQQSGKRAVVLIDEYDKPLLDVLDTGIHTYINGEKYLLEDYTIKNI